MKILELRAGGKLRLKLRMDGLNYLEPAEQWTGKQEEKWIKSIQVNGHRERERELKGFKNTEHKI